MNLQKTILAMGLAGAMAASLAACDSGEGGGDKTKGQIESAAGSVTGDTKLKNDGKKDQVVGGVKDTVGDLKATVHDATK
jgi:uncharacterized protein YjbJ (UPF0337 family)